MNQSTRHTAELALIRAVPELTLGKLKPCRTRGLFNNLQKAVDKDLAYLPKLNQEGVDELESLIKGFLTDIGWMGKQKHTGTHLSFCAGIIENSQFKFNRRITESITNLVCHLEKGNDFKYNSCVSGENAAEKWNELFGGEL